MLSFSIHQILIMELCVGSHGTNVYAFVIAPWVQCMTDTDSRIISRVALNPVPGYSAALYPFVGGEGYAFN